MIIEVINEKLEIVTVIEKPKALNLDKEVIETLDNDFNIKIHKSVRVKGLTKLVLQIDNNDDTEIKIKKDVTLDGSIYVGNKTTIGKNTNILNGVVIGKYNKIGKDVTIGFNVRIGENNTICEKVVLSSTVHINKDNVICTEVILRSNTRINEGNIIGIGAVILGGVRINRFNHIGNFARICKGCLIGERNGFNDEVNVAERMSILFDNKIEVDIDNKFSEQIVFIRGNTVTDMSQFINEDGTVKMVEMIDNEEYNKYARFEMDNPLKVLKGKEEEFVLVDEDGRNC